MLPLLFTALLHISAVLASFPFANIEFKGVVYKHIKQLGKGGQAQVFEFLKKNPEGEQEHVALKKFKDSNDARHEFRVISELFEEGNEDVKELVVIPKEPFQLFDISLMEMEKMGASLYDYLDYRLSMDKMAAAKMNDIQAFASRMLTILDYFRENEFSHGDIKLENVLLPACDLDEFDCLENASLGEARLSDFGCGFFASELKINRNPAKIMAPEVVKKSLVGKPTFSQEGDMWSLGVLLSVLYTGVNLFSHEIDRAKTWEQVQRYYFDIIGDPDNGPEVNFERFRKIMILRRYDAGFAVKKAKGVIREKDVAFTKLIFDMLRFEPSERPLPKKALEYDFFK